MDAIHSGVTLEAVTKLHAVEKRRRIFKSSEWDLEEPAAFARVARSPVELALITGVVIRLFRAVVLTHGDATTAYLGAALVLGSLFLLGMATLHLGRFPVREWPWRAPLFAVFETAGEMIVSFVLIALHREPWGTARAEFVDWQAMATGVVFWRVLGSQRVGAAAWRHGVVHPWTCAQGDRQGSGATDASGWTALHRQAEAGRILTWLLATLRVRLQLNRWRRQWQSA